MRKCSWFLALIFCFWIQASDYVIPEVQYAAEEETEITMINTAPVPAMVTVRGYSEAGQEIGPSTAISQIPAMGGVVMGLAALFGEDAAEVAWVQVHADEALMVMAELWGPGTRSAYWSTSELQEWLYMPHVAKNTATFSTTLSAVNASDVGVYTSLAPNRTGDEVVLTELEDGFGKARHDVLEFWSELSGIDWVFLSSSAKSNAAMEFFTYNEERRMASLGLESGSSSTLRFLHVATDTANFWTGMVYINVGAFDATVTETYFDASGSVIKEFTPGPVSPGGKVTLLFDAQTQDRVPAGTSWVEVTANRELVGYELFGSIHGGADQTFAGIQGNMDSGTRLDYPFFVASSDLWSGFVAVNVGDIAANITFTLRSADGAVLGTHTETGVAPNHKITGLGSAFFPNVENAGPGAWVRAEANGSHWAGFVLWGDQGGAFRDALSGVKAQPGDSSLIVEPYAPYFGSNSSQGQILIEQFSASNCGPCGSAAQQLATFWDDYTPEQMAFLRYASWGSDPYYTRENRDDMQIRGGYYGVTGIPTFWADGVWEQPNAIDVRRHLDYFMEQRLAAAHPFTIELQADAQAGVVWATVHYPSPAMAGHHYLRVAIAEAEYVFSSPPGSNGQQTFHGAMLLMLPDGNGTRLSGAPGAVEKYRFTFDPAVCNLHPPTHMTVIAFVQDDDNQEVVGTSFFGY